MGRFDEIRELFLQCRRLPPGERAALLASACQGDGALRKEVEELLAADADEGALLPEPRIRAQAPLPREIGPYTVLELLGQGGMGAVYKAQQTRPITRTVAIKVVAAGIEMRELLARFEAERQALARMSHPNIAAVLDAGATQACQPYFVMEYVPGVPITRFADEQALTIRQRLELFTQVCEAIAHAHSKGIIHRDIKASNVLAYLQDGRPVAKVIDFGIAKALAGEELTDKTLYTHLGRPLGTYAYMSPEQAEGTGGVDTLTDVYSLGVLLYELLTGQLPFEPQTLRAAAEHEVRRIVREVEPPRPSTRLTAMGQRAQEVARARQVRVEALTRELRNELEWIPLMAMRKEPQRRYNSPLQLAEDVGNYLGGRPLIAGPESRVYRARKLVRKHRVLVAAATMVALALAGGTVGTTMGMLGQRRMRMVADEQAALARLAKEKAEAEQRIAQERMVDALREKGTAQAVAGEGAAARESLGEAWDACERLGLPTEAVELAMLECESRSPSPVAGYRTGGPVRDVSPDGRTIVSAGKDGRSLEFWDVVTGRNVGSIGGTLPVWIARFSPSGKLVVAASKLGQVQCWVRGESTPRWTRLVDERKEMVEAVEISPDEMHVAVATVNNQMRLLDVQTGEDVAGFTPHEGRGSRVRFTPDGKRIIGTAAPGDTHNGSVLVWDAQTGAELARMDSRKSVSRGLVVMPDGMQVGAMDYKGVLVFSNLASGEAVSKVTWEKQSNADTDNVTLSADGKRILIGLDDGTLDVAQSPTGRVMARFSGGGNLTGRCGFLPAGELCWSAQLEGDAFRIWNSAERRAMQPVASVADRMNLWGWGMSADGRLVVVVDEGTIRVNDVATGKLLLEQPTRGVAPWEAKEFVTHAAFLPDGRRLAAVTSMGAMCVLDLVAGSAPVILRDQRSTSETRTISFSADGRLAATCLPAGKVFVWDLEQGKLTQVVNLPLGGSENMVLSADGARVLVGPNMVWLQEWEVATGKMIRQIRAGTMPRRNNNIHSMATLGGDRVATIGYDVSLSVYSMADGRVVWQNRGLGFDSLAASADGTRLSTCGHDRSIRFWDARTGEQIHQVRGATRGHMPGAQYGAKGDLLAVCDGSGAVNVWDLGRPRRQRELGARVTEARKRLQDRPDDAAALATLGEWYALRSVWPWAVELLEQARSGGAEVSSLTLARCYWQMGESGKAREEFGRAIERKETDEGYVRMCLRAVGEGR